MQRKPGFPVANCGIKLPECPMVPEAVPVSHEDDTVSEQRRLQLINFGHSQWGFNNWSWSVTKQEVDFVDFANGKFCAGVVAFVNVTVKTFDIYRENVGYATSVANTKGFAVYKSRKCAVTNALRETLLSFGGSVAAELAELGEAARGDGAAPANQPDLLHDNRASEPRSLPHNVGPGRAPPPPRRDSADVAPPPPPPAALRSPHAPPHPPQPPQPPPAVKNLPGAKSLPLGPPTGPPVPPGPPPANRAPLARQAPPPVARSNSNVSFVLQPMVGGMVPPHAVYGGGVGPRLAAPPVQHVLPPGYYEYPAPWHFAYEGAPGNLNLNFNLPPRNVVVGRGECRADEPPGAQCWVKPTIFYDGFWTEQKVKKWVAEQVEKQFPEQPPSPASCHSHAAPLDQPAPHERS